MLMKSD